MTQELRERIERFRNEYLDRPDGKQLMEFKVKERKEVQKVFSKLKTRQQNGENITDDVLDKLLPHLDTEHNRNRDARISSWPVITKDIRPWFENVGWKDPSEWDETAKWIMEICDAGDEEDWERWQELVDMKQKKGFSTGFITPIVHALNHKLPPINSKVVRTYEDVVPHIDGFKGSPTLDKGLDAYPQESAPDLLALIETLKDYGINGILEWDTYCHWNISKRLGGRTEISVPASEQEVKEIIAESHNQYVDRLCVKLLEAQHKSGSQEWQEFENLLTEAFQVLGFESEKLAGAGRSDIIAVARLGQETFKVSVEAKTTKNDEWSTKAYTDMVEHAMKESAQYIIVVAPDFKTGQTARYAGKDNILLLRTSELVELLKEHSRTGISLYYMRDLMDETLANIPEDFMSIPLEDRPTLLEIEVKRQTQPIHTRILIATEVIKLFDEMQRIDDETQYTCLTERDISFGLWRSNRITKEMVSEVVQFLSHPMVDILQRRDEGYVLTIPPDTASIRLGAIANVFGKTFTKRKGK